MNIILDAAFALSTKIKGGISYLLHDYLNTVLKIDKKNKYVLFGYFFKNYIRRKSEIKKDFNIFNIDIYPVPNIFDRILENSGINLIDFYTFNKTNYIYHSITGQNLPLKSKIKKVITIYDLSFEFNKDWYKDLWFKNIKKMTSIADLIITPSNFTKSKLIDIYKVNEEKIKTIHLGYNKNIYNICKDNEIENFKKSKNLPHNYILTVLTSIKRKNFARIYNSYKNIIKTGRFKEYKMIIVAGSNELKNELLNMIDEKLINNILIFSEVSQKELSLFYAGAKIFLFPSLYEGFGLPVLEAMACGTPVITSNTSSMPEITGDAAILINPYNEDEIYNAVISLIENENLRKTLSQKGLKRAEMFSWEKTVMQTIEAYQEL